jgi:hypothetical protein
MPAQVCTAGIDLLQLGDSILRLLLVAGPGIGGGEVNIWVPILRVARQRPLAPFDRLLPSGQMNVQVTHKELPKRQSRIARAQPKRSFDARKTILAAAEHHLQKLATAWAVALLRSACSIAGAYCRLAKKTFAFLK